MLPNMLQRRATEKKQFVYLPLHYVYPPQIYILFIVAFESSILSIDYMHFS